MKTTKIFSFVAGIALLAATLVPVKVSAASAPMSLTGATQTNGSFSTMVYETSDGAVSSVKLALDFSAPVTDVNYDYTAGVFTTTDPDGYHLSRGSVTGRQPVARVSFKLANPGTVTASIASISEVKGPNAANNGVEYYAVGNASAAFTYNAPAPAPTNNGTAPTTKNTPTNNANNKTATTATTDGEVAGDETKAAEAPKDEDKKKDDSKKSDDKKDDSKDTSSSAWFWPVALLAVVAGYVAARYMRSRAAAKATADAEAAAAAKTASNTPKNKKNKK